MGNPAVDIEEITSGAERVWLERIGQVIEEKKAWQRYAFVAIGLSMLSITGLIYLGGKSEFIPYIVEVDKLGVQLAVQVAERTSPLDRRYVVAQLDNFIVNVRGVSPDNVVTRDRLEKAYAMLTNNSQAAGFIVTHFSIDEGANLPYERAKTVIVLPVVETVLPVAGSDLTWEIVWTESITNRTTGEAYPAMTMRANLTVSYDSVNTVDDIRKNPTGLKLDLISWGEINRE